MTRKSYSTDLTDAEWDLFQPYMPIKFLGETGLECKRINSLLEPESAAAEGPNYKRVLDQLGKTEKKLRPRKRTTLSTYISSMFQNNIPRLMLTGSATFSLPIN